MNKVLIGLTARCEGESPDQRRFYDNESYFEYVTLGGGLPVMIGSVSPEEADEYAEALDGLLITGGEDLNPKFYHEENTNSSLTFEDIDYSDFYLYQAFRKLGKPILGICRGLQSINVIEGGSLIQDIATYDSSKLDHNQRNYTPPRNIGETAHQCSFIKGTRLHRLFGDTHEVNTYHHQNIKQVAEGFTISAYSEDGLVEGIEKDRVFAVQWHPERLVNDPAHVSIITDFIEECESTKYTH